MAAVPSVVLEAPHRLSVQRIEPPSVGDDGIPVRLGACGICGSDVRYFLGENPWALHTLGKNLPSPPNMVLGHEVSGITEEANPRRIAVLAYKSCGSCSYCRTGREHLCEAMLHFGHSAGWPSMAYYPGGMAERFNIWRDFAYEIPDTISHEEATFLDGLAVALHALDVGAFQEGKRVAVIGLGPIGMLAGSAAAILGATAVWGCDTTALPVRLAREQGLDPVMKGAAEDLVRAVAPTGETGADLVIDTVGTPDSIRDGLALLAKSGSHVLLSVHEGSIPIEPILLAGERRLLTSANNPYADFPRAIRLLGEDGLAVKNLITHRFPLEQASKAFELMLRKGQEDVFKVVITPNESA
jgi:threonine dehydrogenase-like Zn-dependent dehydrogenase